MLENLSGFARERHREVLWIVKLIPVAVRRELGQLLAQHLQSVSMLFHICLLSLSFFRCVYKSLQTCNEKITRLKGHAGIRRAL